MLSETETSDILRRYELITAYGAPEPVVVDGVVFDLRCELDTEVWRPVSPLGFYGNLAALRGPRIAFPWTPDDWREAMQKEGELIEARAGSTVRIAMVTTANLATTFKDFEVPEGRERKLAYISVFSPDGSLKLAEPPLLILAETATAIQITMGNHAAAYRGLVAKLERETGLADLESMLDEPVEHWTKPQGPMTPAYGEALFALKDAISDGDEHAYAGFGYLMARAEAEAQLLEPASRERQAEIYRTRGTAARRRQSRTRTERLRDYAKLIQSENRSISLGACARAVAAIVAKDSTWKLSSDPKWISKHIKELFEIKQGTAQLEYKPGSQRTQGS